MAAAKLKQNLLPPIPSTSSSYFAGGGNVSSSRRLFIPGMDVIGLKMRGQGLRSWIRVDARTGISQPIELDKFTIMRRCDLPARDLRLLDPLFVYPSTILGRERAIVVNLEQIRCIITADEVLLLNSLDPYVMQYVEELGRRLSANDGKDATSFGGRAASPDYLPFEFQALEVALEVACTYLDSQAEDIQGESYPFLDQLTSTISTKNLERVRRLKSKLVALTRRVQKVKDEIEQLMDDDGDMAEMYLTEKKIRMENSFNDDQPLPIRNSVGPRVSFSAPITPASSPPEPRKLDKTMSLAWSRHGSSTRSSESGTEKIDELEMLLEAYFVVVDNTLNKLTSLKEYVDDTEDFINIQLAQYAAELLHKADMSSCKAMLNPSPAKSSSAEPSTTLSDPTTFRSIVGALQYLTITRPDIQYSVNALCQHLQQPTTAHLLLLKRLLRYLQGTIQLALPIQPNDLTLSTYSDANWATDPSDRRSISGHCSFLGSTLISWQVKK